MPTTVISDTPTVFASQEPGKPATAQAQLDALSATFPLVHPPSPVSSGPMDPADVQVQAAMSKTQHQLTIEEGKLWEKLTDPNEAVDNDESPTAAILASLREKSTFMVQSYHRRNNPPTETTYKESKNILQAMGVPCIDSTGPYEAEALAASLVLNGCADYVASEDTVRLSFCFSPLNLFALLTPHLLRTFSSMVHPSSATLRAETRPSCSSRAQRCGPRSASTRAPWLTSPSFSERTSPLASGKLAHTGRCNISTSTAR